MAQDSVASQSARRQDPLNPAVLGWAEAFIQLSYLQMSIDIHFSSRDFLIFLMNSFPPMAVITIMSIPEVTNIVTNPMITT